MHTHSSSGTVARGRLFVRQAFTIMEVMIAFSVLAIGLIAVTGAIHSMDSARRMAPEQAVAQRVLSAMVDRFQGARWEVIGDQPWSRPRFKDATNIGHPPLTEDAAVADDNLIASGILQRKQGIDLKVYVEFYRAVAAKTEDGVVIADKPGVMQGEDPLVTYAKPDDFSAIFRSPTLRAKYKLDPSLGAPTAQVGEDDPIVIRLIAEWKLANDEIARLEVFTGRKR
jgi:hypothetical protein